MRKANRLQIPGTRAVKREQDAETFTLSYSAFGVTAGYQEQWKRRPGSTLKDRILVSWINEPEARNPCIMSDRLGVEVSACSGNARRKRLIRILATETMRNYLRSIGFNWQQSGTEELYFQALNDRNARAFERLYFNRPDLRLVFGCAMAKSLSALLDTGVDSESCLRALWSPTIQGSTGPSLRSWSVAFPHNFSKWTGLLLDTVDSCTVAVVTDQCLTLRSRRGSTKFGCKSISRTQDDTAHKEEQTRSLFETALYINDKAHIPCPLRQTRAGDWDLEKGAEFDLGASGRLKFLGSVHGTRGLLMKWSSPSPVSGAMQWFHERVKKSGSRPYHWEQVDDLPGPKRKQIHVIS